MGSSFCRAKLNNLQKLQDMVKTLIQSVPITDRISPATLSVNELIKLDQAMMVHKILNEQYLEIFKQSSQKDFRFQNMKQGE